MTTPTLKIAKLKDMTPTKISVSVTPDLKSDLEVYAALYQQAYGDKQDVTALIPLMLESFLTADTGFRKAKRELASTI